MQCQHAHPGIAEDCVNLTCRKESRESVGISKLTSSRQFRHHSNVTGFPNYRNSYFTRQQGLESTFLFRIHPHDYLKSPKEELVSAYSDEYPAQAATCAKTDSEARIHSTTLKHDAPFVNLFLTIQRL